MTRFLLAMTVFLAAACGSAADMEHWEIGDPWIRPECQDDVVCEDGICWVTLCGGSFAMGSVLGVGHSDEHPRHTVLVRGFEIMQTEITVTQYAACVDDGDCEPWPDSDDVPSRCSWDEEDQDEHPMNCLDWDMAGKFCDWAGGSLPTEAQWEYAARSRGQDVTYPWGEDEPSCDLLQMHEEDCCGLGTSCPVCSFPDGDTEQGLCDMAGNIFEWMQDWYHNTYVGSPRSTKAWEDPARSMRVMRSGAIGSGVGYRVHNRTYHEPDFFYSGMGGRGVREWIPVEG